MSSCHVDATVGWHRHARRRVELPVARSFRAPLSDEHSSGSEFLDAVVATVCDVDAAVLPMLNRSSTPDYGFQHGLSVTPVTPI